MKFSLTQIAAVSGALLLAVAAVPASADLITNGTFNTPSSSAVSWGTLNNNTIGGPGTVNWGSGAYGYTPTNIDGWSFSSFAPGEGGAGIADDGSAFGLSTAPNDTGQAAFLQQSASMTQTVSGLTVGETYTLLFDLEGRPYGGANSLLVTVDGVTVSGPTMTANDVWTSYEATFTATSTSETLEFATTDPSNADETTGIDDVQILTPEPGSLLLMATGVLGFGFMALRRRWFAVPVGNLVR